MTASTAGARTARVLIVEDDPTLATVIDRHLRARGHESRVSASAEEASSLLRSGYRPTVVVLDINLPGDSGWSLLRAGELEAAGSPAVVVVTATHVPVGRLHEFDIAGYLPKPFALETLVSTIERLANPPAGEGDE